MEIKMDETLRDVGVVGFCAFVLKEGFTLIARTLNGKKDDSQDHTDRRLEVAVMQLAEALKNQSAMFFQLIETQNKLLTEMHREMVDQKAVLAIIKSNQEQRWRD